MYYLKCSSIAWWTISKHFRDYVGAHTESLQPQDDDSSNSSSEDEESQAHVPAATTSGAPE